MNNIKSRKVAVKFAKLLREAEDIDTLLDEPSAVPKKSFEEQKSDDIYESYLMTFDAMTKIHESIRKLIEAQSYIEEYSDDSQIGKIYEVINDMVSNELSVTMDKFSTIVRAVRKITFGNQ